MVGMEKKMALQRYLVLHPNVRLLFKRQHLTVKNVLDCCGFFSFFFSRRRPASAFVSLAHLRDRRRPSSPFNFSSPLLPTDTHTARHLAERHAGIAVPAAATETASLSPSARRAPSFSAALQRNRRDAATFLFFLLPCAKGLLLSITCHLILARQLTRSLASAQAKHVRPAPRGANAGAFSQQPLATCKKSKCLEPKHVTFFAVVPHRACAPPLQVTWHRPPKLCGTFAQSRVVASTLQLVGGVVFTLLLSLEDTR